MPDTAPTRSADQAATRDPLLQPLTIGHVTFRNRIMSTSHACGLEEGGMPTEAYRAYHLEKARGGLALSMFGGSSNVDIDSPNIFRQLDVGTDAIIPHLQRFSEAMHAEGAALMCQISHLGRRGDPYAGAWVTTMAPSPLRETLHRAIPKEMDRHDIDRAVRAYAEAARRCREGGLDGIETLAGGHLIGQFLSPRTNRRTDAFGGSLENRLRFALMVHEAIREAAGGRFLVGIRFVVDEGPEGELDAEEAIRAAQMLCDAGAVDFFNAIYGSMDTTRALAEENMPGMGLPIAPWVRAVGRFRAEVGLPVFHAARLADVASARFAVAEGHVDMAGMTRAQIADPHLVAKIAAGEEERIRPCIGASHCQGPYRPACLHNPVTGRETFLHHSIPRTDGPPRRVAVIGAGPAGLEAARVSALRGHEVTVHEAAPVVGGQVVLGATGGWRRDLAGVIDWRAAELDRLGVPVHLNRYMEADEIAALGADVVILATGGLPQIDLAEGGDLALSAWDIVSGQVPVGAEVLVYDGTGRHPAPLAAEAAVLAGAKVHFVSIDAVLAEELTYSERLRWKQRFLGHGLRVLPETRLIGVSKPGNRLEARLINEVSREITTITVDQVIVEQGTIPAGDLFDTLRGSARNDGVTDLHALAAARPQPRAEGPGFELHQIGDAVSSRNIHAALLDALRLCTPL